VKLAVVEQLLSLTMEVPSLVDAFARSDSDFSSHVLAWLQRTQIVLSANQMAIASEIALLRGSVIAVSRGVVPSDLSMTGRPTVRKIRSAAAFNVLRKAEEIVRNTVKPVAMQLAEAEALIRQMIEAARDQEILPESGSGGQEVLELWSRLANDARFRPVAAHAQNIAGRENALILFARSLR
jgi:hypothetical protein